MKTSTHKVKQGSVLGGTLLITGSCVGAGMLGLPIVTGMSGFFPTILMFSLACILMTGTGLLLIEAHQWFHKSAHFSTIVPALIGPIGHAVSWITYLLLFYSLLVAYIAMSTHHITLGFSQVFSTDIPLWIGSIFFVLVFGWIVYLGTRKVDLVNRVLMVGKILSFFLLVFFTVGFIKPTLLNYTDPKYCIYSLPILIVSFGFHNMIPSLQNYLGGDTKRVKQSLVGGAFLTLCLYLVWEMIVLGSLPIQGDFGIFYSLKNGLDGAAALKEYTKSLTIGYGALSLAFFAILTSFLSQTLSLVHFLTDGFKLKKGKNENLLICFLTLFPPLLIACINPDIAFKALNFAGGICAVILFGVLPTTMVWVGRYRREYDTPYRVNGGKPLLVIFFLFSLFIFLYQLSLTLSINIFPSPLG